MALASLLPSATPHATSSTLCIYLLGAPHVALDGTPVTLPRRQLRALLYRLAATAKAVPRDHLCFLFWSDAPEATGRRNLVVMLNHLRRALPLPNALVTTGDTVTLDPDMVVCDTVIAAEAFARAQSGTRPDLLAEVIHRYRGPFLDGFAVPMSAEFEEWATRERQAWERRYLDALAALIEAWTARGDYPAAIDAARRYLATDELAEEVHRRLIALYAVTGDRIAALRQFEHCATLLERELNVRPHPATHSLYVAVRDGHDGVLRRPQPSVVHARASAAAAATVSSSLPAPAVALIGRAAEVAAARGLLDGGDARLLTLSGPGGSGKTRLALQVAWELRDRFTDGAVFVPLAPLRDPALVIGAIAQACGVHQSGAASVAHLLRAHLRDKHLLLVLDNCEHLLAAGAAIAGLLAAAPRLRILATSRILLNLAGEHALPVLPLPLPDLDNLPSVAELATQPAVALMVARAQAVDPAFKLSPANARDLAEICVRLDGLPLAIELAAARLRLLSTRALLDRLDHRLALLAGGSRDLPARQQTLRATLDWSYHLLSAREQSVFSRLAVFAGGWALEAAEAVCGGAADHAVPVLDALQALLDAHLVTRIDGADGEPRFGMLETVREYAIERLEECGAAEPAYRAHVAYLRALADQAVAHAREPDAGDWFRRMDVERANLLVAITWALDHDDPATSLHLAAALGRFWLTRGLLTEGRRLIEAALAATSVAPAHDEARARAHEAAAELALPQGEFAAGYAHLRAAMTIWRALGRRRELALALLILSGASGLAGDAVSADDARAEGKALAEALADPEAMAMVAWVEGREAKGTASVAVARRRFEEALAYERYCGDRVMLTHLLLDLAPMALALGDLVTARAEAEEAVALARDLGHRVATALALNELGEISRAADAYDQAAVYYTESLCLLRDMGNRSDVPRLLHNLAFVALHAGDVARAVSLFRESMHQFGEARIERGIAEGLTGLASVAVVQGDPLRAAWLWGAAEAQREAQGWHIWPPDQREYLRYLARAHAITTPAEFAAAWQECRGLTIAQALAHAVAATATTAT